MPLPLAIPVVASTFIGSLVSAITAAFATKAGSMLAGAGLMFISIKGIETVVGFMVQDINTAMGLLESYGGGGGGWGLASIMMKMAAYVGLFDAINITISGYMAIMSIHGLRVILARAQG